MNTVAAEVSWVAPVIHPLAAVGGSFGALFGMVLFHHKTRHKKFYLGVPGIMIVEGAFCVCSESSPSGTGRAGLAGEELPGGEVVDFDGAGAVHWGGGLGRLGRAGEGRTYIR